LKILFVTDGLFPFQIGGMQKHSSILISHLARLGANLTVIHPAGKEYDTGQVQTHFENLWQLTFVAVPFTDNGRLPGHYVRANKRYSQKALESVQQDLKQFDLIYAQGFTGSAFIQCRQRKELHAPVIVNLHGFEMYQPAADLKNKIAYSWLRREASFNLLHADYVYSFGVKLTKLLEEIGVETAKILEQSNGIDDSWLKENPSKNNDIRTFVFIGRNERRKGLKELQESLQQLLSSGARFHFHFIGEIAENERLNHSNLIYHNAIRDAEKIKTILDQCDCLVIPSHSEGMPTVILEAMSRGLAIVGTNVGAVSKMIDGNGLLLEKPKVGLITEALNMMIQLSPDQLSLFKVRSLELVRSKFRWSEIAAKKYNDFKKITDKS
jgi:glycosyltransferase involved in cell wall biosynthesis